jgi:polyphosphate kinase 2 (PPK2 family)
MLEQVNLDLALPKKKFKKEMIFLRQRLYDLQKAAFDCGMPTVILFEGWDAAGKGTAINLLTSRLDPRGFQVWPVREARTHEKARPWLWRFWLKLPNYGQIGIFDRSWYGRVLVERVEGLIPESEWRRAYRDVVDFEHTIADDGYVIVKFWMHISQEEQKRRFEFLEKDPLLAWHVQPEDWEHHRKYDAYLMAAEEMLEMTETEWGPWTIVEATDRHWSLYKVFRTVADSMESGLAARNALPPPEAMGHVSDTDEESGVLAEIE